MSTYLLGGQTCENFKKKGIFDLFGWYRLGLRCPQHKNPDPKFSGSLKSTIYPYGYNCSYLTVILQLFFLTRKFIAVIKQLFLWYFAFFNFSVQNWSGIFDHSTSLIFLTWKIENSPKKSEARNHFFLNTSLHYQNWTSLRYFLIISVPKLLDSKNYSYLQFFTVIFAEFQKNAVICS